MRRLLRRLLRRPERRARDLGEVALGYDMPPASMHDFAWWFCIPGQECELCRCRVEILAAFMLDPSGFPLPSPYIHRN